MDYKMTRTETMAKIKAKVKAQLMTEFKDFLAEKYGDDSVAMVRTGNSSPVNEIGFSAGTAIDENGTPYDIVCTVNPTVKDWLDRVGTKKTFEAFDFETAKAEYELYVAEKAEKETAKAKEKEKKEKTKADKKREKETAPTETETAPTETTDTETETE
jgi:hypothetical protein